MDYCWWWSLQNSVYTSQIRGEFEVTRNNKIMQLVSMAVLLNAVFCSVWFPGFEWGAQILQYFNEWGGMLTMPIRWDEGGFSIPMALWLYGSSGCVALNPRTTAFSVFYDHFLRSEIWESYVFPAVWYRHCDIKLNLNDTHIFALIVLHWTEILREDVTEMELAIGLKRRGDLIPFEWYCTFCYSSCIPSKFCCITIWEYQARCQCSDPTILRISYWAEI
jgi:hypothetical protein